MRSAECISRQPAKARRTYQRAGCNLDLAPSLSGYVVLGAPRESRSSRLSNEPQPRQWGKGGRWSSWTNQIVKTLRGGSRGGDSNDEGMRRGGSSLDWPEADLPNSR